MDSNSNETTKQNSWCQSYREIMTNKKTNTSKARNKDKQAIKPHLTEAFQGSVIKEIISNVLVNVLEGRWDTQNLFGILPKLLSFLKEESTMPIKYRYGLVILLIL